LYSQTCPTYSQRNNGNGGGNSDCGSEVGLPSGYSKTGSFQFTGVAVNMSVLKVEQWNGSAWVTYQNNSSTPATYGTFWYGGYNGANGKVCFYANAALQSTMLFSYLQGSQSQYGIGLSQNGIFFTAPSSYVYNMGTNLILPNRWYSITLTCQQITTNSILKSRWISYINGNISITTAYDQLYNVGSVLNLNANQSFYIGRRGSTDPFFNGKIGSIKVYNKELSATEVLQNFNASRNRFNL